MLDGGTPPIALHSPNLPVYPQNFAVVEGPRGMVWMGNSDGVLEFDGENWRLWRLPNREIVRSLAIDEAGRVYVGGYNAFGYLQPEASGEMHYVGLESLFKDAIGEREFADIWDVLVAPECVYFKALRDLFCWRPEDGEIRHWGHEGRFGALARIGAETWLQFRGEGLRRRIEKRWEPMSASAPLENLLFDLLPLVDGDVLGVGVDAHFWRITRSGEPTPQPVPANMPAPAQLQNSMVRADGSLVFASAEGDLFAMPADLDRARRIPLAGDFLSGLAESRGGGLLVSADSGLFHVRWPSQWTLIGAEHGLEGGLRDALEWNGRLWVVSGAGLQTMHLDAGSGVARLAEPATQAPGLYALLPVQQSGALLAQARRLSWIDGGRIEALGDDDAYPRLLVASRLQPERALVGTEFGLRSVQLATSPPRLSPPSQPDLAVGITSIAELDDGSVWAGSQRHGLWRYRQDGAGGAWQGQRVDLVAGIETGPIAELSVHRMADDSLLVSTARGFWRGREEAMARVDLEGLEALRDPEEHLRLVLVDGRPRWAFSHYRVFERRADGWAEQSAGGLRRGALLAARALDAERLLLISDQALLVHRHVGEVAAREKPRVRLREVWYEDEQGQRQRLPLEPDAVPRLLHGENALHFAFAAADLDQPASVRYRGQLVGEESGYSAWLRANGYTYFNLGPGTYRMHIQARDGQGRISEITPYELVVVPRWFETVWSKLALAVIALLLITAVARLLAQRRIARTRRQTQLLEQQVGERTAELAEANRRLQTMADLDGLTGLANRRRLDEFLPLAFEQCAARGRPLALLLADVDHFKQFNDRHGHIAGDELIRRLAELLRHSLRRSEDLAARYGGEEFLVILPGAALPLAVELAERLRRDAEASLGGTTISIGVASQVPQASDSVEQLIERADSALYRAKAAGRNRVCADLPDATEAASESVSPSARRE